MALDKFCCCIELRIGCIIWAIVDLISNFCLFSTVNISPDIYVITSGNVIGTISCCCLLYGAVKNNWIAVLVYLVLDMLKIVFYLICAVYMLDSAGAAGAPADFLISVGVVITISVLIFLYFWSCVFSFFKKLQEGSAEPKV